MEVLRMICHDFIIEHWWYFSNFIPFPYITTVGTGPQSYNVYIEDVSEFHSFLRSRDSLVSWSDSQVDHTVIACMFNINVDVLIYGAPDKDPHWQRTSPDSHLTDYLGGSWNDGSVTDVLLYHAQYTHYDLLINRNSSLATFGPLYSRHAFLNYANQSGLSIQTPARQIIDECRVTDLSPLVFPPCPRGPGRPKKKREGAPVLKKHGKRMIDETEPEEPVPKKKRGRPLGSKNKAKDTETETLSLRARAEIAADIDIQNHANSKTCKICNFLLDDPIKTNKGRLNAQNAHQLSTNLVFLKLDVPMQLGLL